ncbi:serine hydrolase domain-containing protein [Hyphococcus sp.]|uniref:serine hydrolase domain-containing protein n=1 Tax=Hyphococcus sp. TaxID=2038636 RepID=UPI0035C6BE12
MRRESLATSLSAPASGFEKTARRFVARRQSFSHKGEQEVFGADRKHALCAALIATLCVACSGGGQSSVPAPAPSPTPTPQGTIEVSDLTGSSTPGLVKMSELAAPSNAMAAFTPFSGTIAFRQTRITANFGEEFDGSYGTLNFPGFSVQLLSDGDDLIPVQRGLISTWGSGASYWDVIVGAGKIWVENGDQNWNRASIPLTLASRRTGQARNCIALFLFDMTRVSKSYVQCSQESSPVDVFNPGDMRALVPLSYKPSTIADEAKALSDYQAEISDRLPTQAWSAIDDANGSLMATFNTGAIPLNEQSYGGLLYQGVLYEQTRRTRHGPYPYPKDMRYGAFSVTKSMSGALSLLYLAERYGESIFDAKITDYAPALATHPGWQGVTFEHALNMVTGLVTDDRYQYIGPFQDAESADQGLAVIAGYDDAPPAPGAAFRYSSLHTFTLSYAMQEYVKTKEGANVNYWDLVEENVLEPIGVYHFPIQKTLEPGGADGIPTLGWGAFPTADDVAKIALLFQNEGEHNGAQVLHRARTRDALSKTSWPGYIVNGEIDYKNSFWTTDRVVNGCSLTASYMEGHGGNYAVLLPSGVVALRFMDRNDYNITPLVQAAEEVKSSC